MRGQWDKGPDQDAAGKQGEEKGTVFGVQRTEGGQASVQQESTSGWTAHCTALCDEELCIYPKNK